PLPGVATVVEDVVRVTLDAAIRGVATGQSVVLYAATRVIGSATITATGRRGSSVAGDRRRV
ncbi:MAG: aminomethyltransferase beta-barrel domain-containing protein, partial [Candidatus Phosphoribacter baldrii]